MAEAHNRQVIGKAIDFASERLEQLRSESDDPLYRRVAKLDEAEPALKLECAATDHGAWALVFEAAEVLPTEPYDWSQPFGVVGRVAIAHVDRDGTLVRAPIRTLMAAGLWEERLQNKALFARELHNCCEFTFGGLQALEFFDFDADERPEVFVKATYGHEGSHDIATSLLTFQGGRIVPVPGSEVFGATELRDVTGDGRPDLVKRTYVDGGESCGSGFPASAPGLEYVAHSLPDGSFSVDDAEARAFVRRQCPAPPTTLATHLDVLCARAWGHGTEELVKRVKSEKAPWDCEREETGRPQKPRASAEYPFLLDAAQSRPPFTLKP